MHQGVRFQLLAFVSALYLHKASQILKQYKYQPGIWREDKHKKSVSLDSELDFQDILSEYL